VAREVVAAAGSLPVTAKIRIGWDSRSVNALETARILEGEGISRLAVHGRTKEQGYTGEADWQVIGAVADAVKIPVIGNGDIDSAAVALKRLKETNVSGLMIGRAAMCHPWIFREIRSAMDGGGAPEAVTLGVKWEFIFEHTRREVEWWGGKEELAIRSMRARFMSYTRGLPGGARLRERLQQVTSEESLRTIAEAHVLEYGDLPV
jgi:tRNA-dihydrouridine synthase